MSNLIYKKMSDVMKEIGFVSKAQTNQAQGFKFRGIDQFVNSLYPALCKHSVFMVPRCVKEEHELKDVTRASGKPGVDKHVTLMMEYDFFAEDGSKVVVGPVAAEGLDSGDKATNKALSAALKYALIQTFSIPTEDMAEGDLDTPVIQPTHSLNGKVENNLVINKSLAKDGILPVSNHSLLKADASAIHTVTTVATPALGDKPKTNGFSRSKAKQMSVDTTAPVIQSTTGGLG